MQQQSLDFPTADLWIAIAIVAVIATDLAVFVGWLFRHPHSGKHKNLVPLLLVLSIVLALGLLYGTKDRLAWARWLPFSATIIYSNIAVLALAIAAGLAFRLPNRPRWRQVLSATVLALLAIATLVQPLAQPILRPTVGGDVWTDDGVCIQTQPATCSSAAAATLLVTVGIPATEAQMVLWNLNDSSGTASLGLWRGLSLATIGTAWHPRVFTGDVEQLLATGPWPAVLAVGLPPEGADPMYQEQHGWAPGFRHSVVLFGVRPDGVVEIGDPSVGREWWTQDDLRVLWRGDAIHLVHEPSVPNELVHEPLVDEENDEHE